MYTRKNLVKTKKKLKVINNDKLFIVSKEQQEKPVTRSDCQEGGPMYIRPCPFYTCKHNLLVMPTKTGIKSIYSEKELVSRETIHTPSCVLDVVDAGLSLTTEDISKLTMCKGSTDSAVVAIRAKGKVKNELSK